MIEQAELRSELALGGINPGFRSAAREQTSLLAPIERVCLSWLAREMPEWVTPDKLTLLGFAAMFVAGASYAAARWWAPALLVVNLMLAVNWFGDSLDGTLARVRCQPARNQYQQGGYSFLGAFASQQQHPFMRCIDRIQGAFQQQLFQAGLLG